MGNWLHWSFFGDFTHLAFPIGMNKAPVKAKNQTCAKKWHKGMQYQKTDKVQKDAVWGREKTCDKKISKILNPGVP